MSSVVAKSGKGTVQGSVQAGVDVVRLWQSPVEGAV